MYLVAFFSVKVFKMHLKSEIEHIQLEKVLESICEIKIVKSRNSSNAFLKTGVNEVEADGWFFLLLIFFCLDKRMDEYQKRNEMR